MVATAGKTYDMPVWGGAQTCTGRVAPGAAALLAWLKANQPAPPERSMGIYNCRTVRGGTTTSLHGEGRAVDWGVFPLADDGTGTPAGHALVDRLLSNAEELGIQCIIYDRRIWSRRSPGSRRYGGTHPHYNHLHIELTWDAARSLTLNQLVEVLGGTADKPDDVPDLGDDDSPKPPPPAVEPDPDPEVVEDMETVNLSGVTSRSATWKRGQAVKVLQGALLANGYGPEGLTNIRGLPDGIAGPATKAALGAAQRAKRTGFPSNPSKPDYIAGEGTWRALLT